MGEASQPPAPPNSGRAQEGIASSSAVYPVCSHSQSLSSGSNQTPQAPTGHYQQFAFSSQFEMPPYQNGGGPYSMGHMASSLPQGNYRLGEAKFSGHQMMTHLTHMGQIGQMGQHFYVPHPAQMATGYYAPVSPSQQQARLPSQPAAYYGAQMATGNPQSMGVAYYCYPPPGLYPPAHDHLALQPVSNGQPHGPVRRHRSLQTTTSSPSYSRKGSSVYRHTKPKFAEYSGWLRLKVMGRFGRCRRPPGHGTRTAKKAKAKRWVVSQHIFFAAPYPLRASPSALPCCSSVCWLTPHAKFPSSRPRNLDRKLASSHRPHAAGPPRLSWSQGPPVAVPNLKE